MERVDRVAALTPTLLRACLPVTHVATPPPFVRATRRHASLYGAKPRHPWLAQLRPVPSLSDQLRVWSFLSGNTAAGNLTAVARDWTFVEDARKPGAVEIILGVAVFAGMPKTTNALSRIREEHNTLPHVNLEADDITNEMLAARGEALLREIYGKNLKLKGLHPDFYSIVRNFAYGRVLARGICTARERELCALASLTGDIVFPQFRSHIFGALNCGATLEDVRGVLDVTEFVWGGENQAMVDGFWEDFIDHLRRNGQYELYKYGLARTP